MKSNGMMDKSEKNDFRVKVKIYHMQLLHPLFGASVLVAKSEKQNYYSLIGVSVDTMMTHCASGKILYQMKIEFNVKKKYIYNNCGRRKIQ